MKENAIPRIIDDPRTIESIWETPAGDDTSYWGLHYPEGNRVAAIKPYEECGGEMISITWFAIYGKDGSIITRIPAHAVCVNYVKET